MRNRQVAAEILTMTELELIEHITGNSTALEPISFQEVQDVCRALLTLTAPPDQPIRRPWVYSS